MTIQVKRFSLADIGDYRVDLIADNKEYEIKAFFQRPVVPPYFYELFTILHILSPGSPLWYQYSDKGGSLQLEGKHEVYFEEPISEAGLNLLHRGAKVMGFDLDIFSKFTLTNGSIIGRKELKEGHQVLYSGGKESSFIAYALHEIIGGEINLTIRQQNRISKWIPPFGIAKIAHNFPWQSGTMVALGIAHAYQNGINSVEIGQPASGCLPEPCQYSIHGKEFHKILEGYLKEVNDGQEMRVWSPCSFAMEGVFAKILKARYPETLAHLDCVPPHDLRYHLVFLRHEIPLPDYITEYLNELDNYTDLPIYARLLHKIELDTLKYLIPAPYDKTLYLYPAPIFSDIRPHPWIESALWHERTKPRYLEKELKGIIKNHVTLDLEDRVKAASDKWLEENR